MAIGCLRHMKSLGAGKYAFTFMMSVSDGSIASWSNGIIHYYNLNKTQLPDNDEPGTITIVMGKASRFFSLPSAFPDS